MFGVIVLMGLALTILEVMPPPPAVRQTDPAAAEHSGFAVSGGQTECLACHRAVYDIRDAAPQLYQGRLLFRTLGCIDCHRMDSVADYEKRKIGPDLRHIQSKLSRSFVAHWIVDPASFRSTTAMPRIFSPSNGNAPLEAEAITEYLFEYSTPIVEAIPPGLTADARRGKLLFEGHGLEDSQALAANLPPGLKAGLGCLACHANPSQTAPLTQHFGPDLSAIGEDLTIGRDSDSARRWLFTWLKNPRHYSDYTLMPNLRLSDQEALDLSEYLMSQKGRRPSAWKSDVTLIHAQRLDLGAELITHYGCANCHEIAGPVSLAQTALDLSDWGDKPLEKLDFSRLGPGSHTRRDWLMQHLTDPEIPAANVSYDKPRMPIFHLDERRAEAVTTYVLANRRWQVDPALVTRAMNPEARAIAKGRALTELHNCVGCHQTESNTPAIQEYFKPGWISTYAPPTLRGEGNKVRPEWLSRFLPDIQPIRPLLMVRMPSFTWKPGEVSGLIDYFRAASQRESRELRRWRQPELTQWALLHGQAAAIDLDPRYSSAKQIAQTHRDIAFKARFTADLCDISDSPEAVPPVISDGDFARGRLFLRRLQCLDCHLMGGVGRARAPDLGLTAARLQPRWVRAWVQEPDVVMHGTNMPPYFSGLSAGVASGRPLPMEEFGRTVQEQTRLLIDFLYSAGSRAK